MYLWEKPGWPLLTWDEQGLSTLLASVSRQQGRLLGRMEALGFDLAEEALTACSVHSGVGQQFVPDLVALALGTSVLDC